MPTTPADIAAYVGAAAWFPQILRWGYRAYAKPVITVLPDNQVEIGFTNFGPIFNIHIDLAVDRKDAIIDKISVSLRHTDNDSHVLTWMGIHETFSEINDQAGGRQVVERRQNAIALKLSTITLTEKFIRFQDPEFHRGYLPALNEATAHQAFLMKDDPNYQDKLLSSEPMHRLLEEYKKYFWWKAGKYTLKFSLTSPSKIAVKDNLFEFELNQSDIDALRLNLNLLKPAFENNVKNGVQGFKPKPIPWTWRNPKVSRIQ